MDRNLEAKKPRPTALIVLRTVDTSLLQHATHRAMKCI